MSGPVAVLTAYVNANVSQGMANLAAFQSRMVATDRTVSARSASATKSMSTMGQAGRGAAAGLGAAGASATRFSGLAKGAATGGALALTYGLYQSVKVGMEFERQMSALGAVTGASGSQMEQFERQAISAARGTIFSATEAAQAQIELAKGGLSAKQILGGALPAALDLAAAGELELADAATTTVNAMKLFGLRGDAVVRVADMMATAANTTTADVDDFAMALRQGGSAAQVAGLSLNDTMVILESLAEIGVKNSDAGTSMKTALLQLSAPTSKQAAEARRLGLEFYDQAGNMKGAIEISGMLRREMGHMTREQRIQSLKILAGTDGFRTLAALYNQGAGGARNLAAANRETGTAAETAAKKTDNLAGDLERLGGALESAGIAAYNKMEPGLRTVTQGLTSAVEGTHNWLSGIESLKPDFFDNLGTSAEVAEGAIDDLTGSDVEETIRGAAQAIDDFYGRARQARPGIADLSEPINRTKKQLQGLSQQRVAAKIGVSGQAQVAREISQVSTKLAGLGQRKAVLRILADTTSPEQKLRALNQLLAGVKGKRVKVEADTGQARSQVASVNAVLNSVRDKTVTVTIRQVKQGISPFASGGRDLSEQIGLVGEQGPELARMANGGLLMLGEKGPHLFPVERGMDIFTAAETRELLAAGIPGFAKGKKEKAAQKKAKKKAKQEKRGENIAGNVRAALQAIENQITREEELVEIATVMSEFPSSPEGEELSTSERTDLIGRNQGLLGSLGTAVAALKKLVADTKVPKGAGAPAVNDAIKEVRDAIVEIQGLTGDGGKILDVKQILADLGGSASVSASDSVLSDLLREQFSEMAQRFAVSQAQFAVLRGGLPPFAGSYAEGGVVPGPAGAPRTVIAHGGEVFAGMGGIKVQVNGDITNVPRGKDPVEVLVGDRRFEAAVERVTRKQARRGGRRLPSGGGGVYA